MLLKESIWIKGTIEAHLTKENFPLLNVGSSTEHFRKVAQPYIYSNIFKPLESKNWKVIHTDMKAETGVDMVGDINNRDFRQELRRQSVKCVLCSNLLEHLADPKVICKSIVDLLDPGGLMIVTVPNSYPYHKDPIDTLFRPSVGELVNLFENCDVVTGSIVEEEGTFREILFNNKKYLLIMIARWFMPFYKFKEWRLMIKDLLQWNEKFKVSCVLLRKSNIL